MRILTVRQPWAWAIIHGGKDVENRVRNIAGDYRGPVAIHVALAEDKSAMGPRDYTALNAAKHAWFPSLTVDEQKQVTQYPWREWLGQIIGVVDLSGVHHGDWCWDGPGAHCSRWAESDTYHLALANPRPLAEPIPYRGALGLRRLDDETTARVLDGIAA